jgi:hypothetical protein
LEGIFATTLKMEIKETRRRVILGSSPSTTSAPLLPADVNINLITISELPLSTHSNLESPTDAMLDALPASIMHDSDFCLAG